MTDSCPKCGHQHDPEKCTGHNARGLPCGNRPIRGGRVCSTHGGSAPQVKAAAEQRQAEAAADVEVRKLWAGLAGASPVKDPVDLLARTAAVLEQATDVVGERVNALGNLAAGESLTQLRGELVLLERLLDKLIRSSGELARLGLAERHVQLEQARAEMVASAFLAALEVAGLVPEVRSVVVERFLGGLTVTSGPASLVLPPGGGEAA